MINARIRLRSLITDILLWAVLCALLSIGFTNIYSVSERYPGISLRFDESVSSQAAYAAREYAIEHRDEAFWPTFWQEELIYIYAEYAEAQTHGIYFSGDAGLVWPCEYIAGTAPGFADTMGLALSSSLARRLWGGTDIVGKTVIIDDDEYIVRGVFEGEEDMALVSAGMENLTRGFLAAQLTGGPDGATRDTIESYAIASGLGKPSAILNGSPVFIAGLMAASPLIVLTCYALYMLISWLWSGHRMARQVILFTLMLSLAALLPTLLDAMPDWLIPGSWSDFSFWEDLMNRLDDNVMEFLRLTPGMRDAEGKLLLLRQAGIAYLGTIFALLACFRWHVSHKRQAP